MEKGNIELNAAGMPRKKRKDGEYIYRPGRPKTKSRRTIFCVDADLETWLYSHGKLSTYINGLIRQDMELNKQ